jgi:FkbM family methyltransferase
MRSAYQSLFKRIISPEFLQIRCRGIWLFVNSRDEVIAPALINEGVYERLETELFEDSVRLGMVIVDIGSNLGYYACIAAKLLKGTGRVYAFEPDPKNYDLLIKNTQLNGYTNVVAINKAVADKIGMTSLFLNGHNLGGNSLSQHNVSSTSSVIEVETTTLDEFVSGTKLLKIDLLKIDVEGAEGLVFSGAKKLLANGPKRIFMEFWPDGLRNLGTDASELARRLTSYGYGISVINENQRRVEKLKDENAISELIERCRMADTEQCSKVNLLLEKVF